MFSEGCGELDCSGSCKVRQYFELRNRQGRPLPAGQSSFIWPLSFHHKLRWSQKSLCSRSRRCMIIWGDDPTTRMTRGGRPASADWGSSFSCSLNSISERDLLSHFARTASIQIARIFDNLGVASFRVMRNYVLSIPNWQNPLTASLFTLPVII